MKKKAEIKQLRNLLTRIVLECKAGAVDYDEVPKELLSEAIEMLGIDPDSLPSILIGAGDPRVWRGGAYEQATDHC